MKMIHSFSVVCFSLSGALKRFVDPTIAITRHKHSTSKKVTSTTLSTDEVSTMTRNFITNIIDDDLKHMRNGGRVLTRFPPEPNGYLHLGHAKSICLNFGISKVYNGTTNMRFDDTNPEKENMEYINSILRDVRWLIHGDFDKDPWNGEIKHASDYFESIYQAAVYLIKSGLAYVDDLSQEEMRLYRGTLTEPGRDSPFRSRSIDENLKLFEDMRTGKFSDGHCVLRAKIDNTSPNINMRDPTLYRIKNAPHPITGNKWCIYPMYDFAHALSDALEGITHSLCTLEFADHRPLYDWTIEKVMPSGILPYKKENWRPKQIEFSRLNLEYTVLSKRKLIQLVSGGYVDGWDDPRMPTISAIRRRGYPYKAIQLFCDRIGISRAEGTIDITIFEETIRDYLDAEAPRIFAVMDPLKITITNWDKDLNQIILAENHPKKSNYGNREVTFSKTLYIDRSDFFDSGLNGDKLPPKGFKRLLINNTVRLKYGYVITCNEVIRDSLTNEAKELLCTYDPNTSNGQDSVNIKKPKGIIQWVSELNSVPVHLNIYDRLFSAPFPGKDKLDGDFLKDINPDSKHVITTGFIEKSISDWKYGTVFQFERLGYFYLDPISNQKQINDPVVVDKPLVFNRVVTLKDTWQQLIDNNDKKEPKVENKPSSNVIEGLSASVDTYGDFNKLDMRVGKVLEVQKHPEAENLYIQKVDCGESTGPRIIVSGLVRHFTPEQLLQQSVIVLCNLKPSKLRGVVSDGMILAAVKADDENGSNAKEIVELISPPANTNPGEKLFISESNKVLMDRSTISKDVWVRIAPKMKINPRKELCFGSDDIVIKTNYGVCVTSSISNAIVR